MNVNVPLREKVLTHITNHPEEWNQRTWGQKTPCGTVACLAGHAVLMTGHDVDYPYEATMLMRDRRFSVREVASTELGLPPRESCVLFSGGNTLGGLWHIASLITDGAIVAPDGVPEPTQLDRQWAELL